MVNMIVAAALAAATPAVAPPAAPPAEPAMFVVRDADTTIYIFGTFHALDGQSQWFGDQRPRRLRAVRRAGARNTHSRKGRRPSRSSAPGFRPPSVTPSASFLATTRMAINAGRAQGMQVGNGADMVLRHVAEAEGKPVEGLETLQLQIDMFNRLPPAPARSPQRQPAATAAARSMGCPRRWREMQAAWKRGDQSVFVRMLEQLKAASPDTYRMMFTERNDRWADWIRARMQTPGTVFVAVGAGHLAGPDSLLVRLAERGIPSQRVH